VKAPQGLGHRAQRTGLYAESKLTNWARFNPGGDEIRQVLTRFERQLDEADGLLVRAVPVRSPSFLLPVTCADVIETLDRVPTRFTAGLRAVFLLGGSAKQKQVASGRLFAYGSYGYGFIFLHAYPANQMTEVWPHLPKPSVRREYERAGAVWRQVTGGWQLEFTPESLRRFYLNDVLLHEVGHHVDRGSGKNKRDAEAFANWMAIELASGKLALNP
jgi:hypothetical protein